MRKVTFNAASSLDGYIAPDDESMDWIHHSSDTRAAMGDYWRNVDAVLLGRKTYEWARKNARGASAREGISSYVFSRSLESIDDADAELVRGDAGEFVRRLKNDDGKNIALLGGGELARALFEAKVIDEVELNVHPILFGSGAAIFPGAGRVKLEMLRAKPIQGGCILATYKVKY